MESSIHMRRISDGRLSALILTRAQLRDINGVIAGYNNIAETGKIQKRTKLQNLFSFTAFDQSPKATITGTMNIYGSDTETAESPAEKSYCCYYKSLVFQNI